MNNPDIQHVTVSDSGTLLLSGCGKFKLQYQSGSGCFLGGASVDPANAATVGWAVTTGVTLELQFAADVALYARSPSGQSTVLKVVRWF